MIYLLIVNVSLIISFALYRLIFRKLTFFQWNRVYLIGMIFFSLLAPIGIFIELPKAEIIAYSIPMVDLSGYMEIAINSPKEQPIYLIDILTYVYWVGAAIAFILLLFRVIKLVRALQDEHDYLSFSFFNKIIIGESIKEKSSIESHERVHVDQGHSYDLLVMELLKIFNWFNPVLYFFQKELKFQHECIADEICSTDKVAYAEMLVAHALQVDHLPLTHEFSNHSFLKKRIMMLFKNKSARKKRLLYTAVLPMLLLVAGSTLVFNTTRAKDIVSDVESSINQVEIAAPTKVLKEQDEWFGKNIDIQLDTIKSRKVADANQAKLDAERVIAEQQMKGRDSSLDSLNPNFNAIFTAVEIVPQPEGGMANFMNWVSTNYAYPKEALDRKVSGVIEISFVVEKDGSLSEVNVKRDLGYGTKEAALELMKKAKKWKPGIQNRRIVRVAYTLPIRLNLSDGKENQVMRGKPTGSPVLGAEGLEKWFIQNFKFPRKVTKEDLDPVIQAYLTINADGSIESVLTNSDLGPAFSKEAASLLEKSKWIPALKDGKPVESIGLFRIKFTPEGGYVKNYTRVDVNSEPVGGMIAYRDYVMKHYAPNSTGEDGNVVIQFMVEKDGELSNFKVVNTPDTKAAQELVKLLQRGTKWRPGILDGSPIKNQYELTLRVMKMNGDLYNVYRWEGVKVQKIKS
ncbi:M56 family metallopeptidase [Sphingobacterium sp. BIGb0165]|uniref:M56 family metallopeptidase n=1 Tax=Sphingobacterium sp. BIGb0165 TaxID=2940615 RepID=UPI002168D5DE|nr:M56 family metallopeptidase [Sphingobacterium sp. BIGb0165]MCS4228279.1 TonB family protein [Sphingobacterium sp. BIGb0165]